MSVHFEQRGHVGLVTIDRPERRGAMNEEAYSELAAHWRTVVRTPSIRVAVITGVQDSYCAGADLKEFIPKVATSARERLAGADPQGADPSHPVVPDPTDIPDGQLAVLRDIVFPKPIVAAVNGPCVASGMEMLLGTDVRFASPNAVFGLPEVCRGLFASGGSTVRLPRQVPFVHAMDILLTGRYLSADEAVRIGLINRVVPRDELLDCALAMAEMIAANSPTAVVATKQSVMRGLGLPLDEAFKSELAVGDTVFASDDAREGPRAFLEKRAPSWSDADASTVPAWAT
jgi:enoyl-CoA hydratase/carnithine racemase